MPLEKNRGVYIPLVRTALPFCARHYPLCARHYCRVVRIHGVIAQLVEHRADNAKVAGSSPAHATERCIRVCLARDIA